MIKPCEIRTQLDVNVEIVVDGLIRQRWNGREAVLFQSQIVEKLINLTGYDRKFIFDNNLLDFEQAYRDNGWSVVYDKPAYNESYDATFTFTKSRN